MKYLLVLLAGLASGVLLFALLLYANPLVESRATPPITVTGKGEFALGYTATPMGSIAWVDNGESSVRPRPPLIKELEEPAIEDTLLIVTLLQNSRGMPAGFGVKFLSPAEETGLLRGVYPMQSAWHIWLLDRGGLMIDQTENHYFYLRDVVLQAHLDSGDNWRGSWFGVLTDGPNQFGTARVSGGSGSLSGVEGKAAETVTAKAYSAASGPASIDGRITISLATE